MTTIVHLARPLSRAAVLGGVVAAALGLALGLASLLYSPLVVLAMLLVAAFLYASLKRPEMAILGILVATSSLVFEERLPLLQLGSNSLHISDLLLLGLLAMIAIRWLAEPNFGLVRTPLDIPILLFLGAITFATVVALVRSNVEFQEAARGFRQIAYYLTFFIVTNLVRERRQLRLLIRGIFALATIVTIGMIIQYLVGSSNQLVAGYVGQFTTSTAEFPSATRIVPPGRSLLLLSFITLGTILTVSTDRSLRSPQVLQWILIGFALLLTFLRSYWVAAAIALVIAGSMSRWKPTRSVIFATLLVILLTGAIFIVILTTDESRTSEMMSALQVRVGTLSNPKTLTGSSLEWRNIENEYALNQVAKNPVLGLGLGVNYRPFDLRIDSNAGMDARSFIHNGHLWVLLSGGLLGYVAFIFISITFLARGLGGWRQVASAQLRGTVLGFSLTYLALLIAALVNGVFGNWIWTPILGIMMGINEIIISRANSSLPIDESTTRQ